MNCVQPNEAVCKHLTVLKSKDVLTYEHSLRVGQIAIYLADHLQFSELEQSRLVSGCYLHDIGKLYVPDEILNKPGSLNDDEWEMMKLHTVQGAQMLRSDGAMDLEIVNTAAYHHERWNGEGYPYGMQGDAIPELARFCSVIDSLDCMLSDRPYRKGMQLYEAKRELLLQSGEQFDTYVVNAVLSLPDECLKISNSALKYY
ncbi:HD-GYP domain-containing protein [Paenibacillus planticolens]|nr:HD-GYP domain-containing protein [Paenibacillus planticolens]